MPEVVTIGGVAIGLAGEGRARVMLDAATRWMDRGDQADCVVRATGSAGGRAVPARSPDVDDLGLRVWWEPSEVVLAHDSGASASIAHDTAEVRVGDGDGAGIAVDLFLPLVLSALLAPRDRFIVHGAALARDDAVIALGDTGAGKSTLAAVALDAGWRVLSDDLVVVWRDADRGVVVQGFPSPLSVPPDVAAAALAGAPPRPGDHERRRVELRDVVDRDVHRLGGVLLVEHDPADGSLRDTSGSAVVDVVLASTFFVGAPAWLRRFYPVAADVARLPAWRFGHAADPSQRVASGARLLDTVARALASR